MSVAFLATFNAMVSMLIFVIVGFFAKKAGFLPNETTSVFSKALAYIFLPALIINTFMNYCTVERLKNNITTILYSALIIILASVLASFLAKLFVREECYDRHIYNYALIFANFAYMGNVIVPAVLGEEALLGYLIFCLPINFMSYSYGFAKIVPSSDGKKFSLKSFVNPVFIAIIIGMILGLTGVGGYLPQFLKSTLSSASQCMGPAAMILLGFSVGGFDILKIFKNVKIYIASFVRLILLPTIFISVLLLLKADRTTVIFTLFAYATPLGLNTVVFPIAYGKDGSLGAALSLLSTVFSVITIPLLYSLLNLII